MFMRLAEFGNKIAEHLTDGKLKFNATKSESRTNYYVIKNYNELYKSIEFLTSQDLFAGYISKDIERILSSYSMTRESIQIPVSDYRALEEGIKSLNSVIQLTLGIVNTFTTEQDEHVINIKLPDAIKSISEIQEFNKRLENIFRIYNLTGEFEFKGFDKGSEWYEFLITAGPLYEYFVSTLSVALDIINLKRNDRDNTLERVMLELLMQKGIETSKEDLDKDIVGLQAKKQARNIVKQLGEKDGKSTAEMETMTVKAITELVRELKQGTEFHLSLNPPKYISEQNNGLTLKIDYYAMKKEVNSKKTKALDKGKE